MLVYNITMRVFREALDRLQVSSCDNDVIRLKKVSTTESHGKLINIPFWTSSWLTRYIMYMIEFVAEPNTTRFGYGNGS